MSNPGSDFLSEVSRMVSELGNLIPNLNDLVSNILDEPTKEVGNLLADRVKYWRTHQALSLVKKLDEKIRADPTLTDIRPHPRLIHTFIEFGSLVSDEMLQDKWVNLILTGSDQEGTDDSNVKFMTILSQMTSAEVKVMDHLCSNSTVSKLPDGGKTSEEVGPYQIYCAGSTYPHDELMRVAEVARFFELDQSVEHLIGLRVLQDCPFQHGQGGFTPGWYQPVANSILPTGLGITMWLRCNGSKKSPHDLIE